MANYVTNVDITSADWTSLSSGFSTVQVMNTTSQPVALAVADTKANIAGSLTIKPGEAFPFMSVPAGAQVWAKIPTKVGPVSGGNIVPTVFTGKVAVYKPA
ncbi:hypothetical protein EVC30_043 [Rhizobium phage RHph_Y1_11]|nr:hypothetical protein EVC30_043 [Rhizobium phage RHph_Y1_11]